MLLLAGIVIIGISIQIYQNYISKKVFKNLSDQMFYMLVAYIFSALSTYIGHGCKVGGVSTFAIIDGIAYGILLPTEVFCLLQAYACGPMALTSLCLAASIMIPIIPSWIFWGDPITWNQIVGMAIMFVAIILILNIGNDIKKKSINRRWVFLCLIAFLGSGLTALTEKVLKVSPYAEHETAYLLSCFITAMIVTAIAILYNIFVRKEKITMKITPGLVLPMAGVGVSTWLVGIMNLSCLAVLPASVFFTVNNGARLIGITLIDILFFKQKITPKQYAGLILGIVGIALLGL